MTVKSFIANHYGGKKAFLKDILYRLMYIMGCVSSDRRVYWHEVKRLVFVCRGNICRSPYAEYRARSLGLPCISFGLITRKGKPVNKNAQEAALLRDIDLSNHQATNIENYKYQDGDLLIGFEPWHIKSLKLGTTLSNTQIILLGSWCQHSPRPYIHDPYGLNGAYFDNCFTRIDDAIENIAVIIQRDKQISWRSTKRILVSDADSIGSLAVIRSLGRAGYRVFACSSQFEPMGFKSNFASYSETNPGYNDYLCFLDWLRNFIKEHAIDAIIPSESFYLAIKPVFSEFAHLLPCSHDANLVYHCLSKYDLFHMYSKSTTPKALRRNLQDYILVDTDKPLPETQSLFEQLGSPLYAKVDAIYSRTDTSGKVCKLVESDNAKQQLGQLASEFRRILIQKHVPGVGVGVFFFVWDGTVKAHFMHIRLHEVPHTGGVSSYRSSWWHSAIYHDALKRIEHLKWNGIAMLEYRWDSITDQFGFLELNSRFWGSLHLALHSGVDFPSLLVDAFLGRPQENMIKFKQNVRCRLTFPNEIQHVWSKLKDKHLLRRTRFLSIIEFFLLSLNPKIYSDMLFAGDRHLYWFSMRIFFLKILKRKKNYGHES